MTPTTTHLTPSPAALRTALGPHAQDVEVHLHASIDSTNTEARRRAPTDGDRVTLDIATEQTAGRGRLGRSFHSPGGTGLYMTLAYTRHGAGSVTVTAQTAVAAAEAIEVLTGRSPGIKWVNDLYLPLTTPPSVENQGGTTMPSAGKLAGILCEAVPLEGGRTRILVGLGINLTTRDFPDGLRAPAVSLFAPGEEAAVTAAFIGTLAGTVVHRLLTILADTTPDGTAACLAAYRRRLMYVGERVLCTRGRESFAGILRGVDADYSLLVEVDGRIRVLSSGEISVRKMM